MNKSNYSADRLPMYYSRELRELVASMLIRDPRLRPNCEQILGNKCTILYLSKRLANIGNSITKPKEEVNKEQIMKSYYDQEKKVENYEMSEYGLSRNRGNGMDPLKRKGSLKDTVRSRKQNKIKRFVSKANKDVFDIKKYEDLFDKEEKKVSDVPCIKQKDILIDQKNIEVPFTGKSK